jgi:hypothetical protein
MNVKELSSSTLGTLGQYCAAALSLTMVTVWIVIAFQSKHLFKDKEIASLWLRLAWPVLFIRSLFTSNKKSEEEMVSVLDQYVTQSRGRRRPVQQDYELA